MEDKKFSEIYNEYAKDIYRFCVFKVSNKQEAEDLTSEIFVDLYKQKFEEIGHVRGWLYQVARNKIYAHYNKAMKSDDSENEQVSQLNDTELVSSLKSTESIAVERVMIEKIESELKNLDSVTSEIIVLKLWNEMSFVDIAKIIDTNTNSIKTKFYRGIEQIKANLSMEVKREKSYKLNSFAFIFAGVIGITSQPAYAFSVVSTSLTAGIGSILGINLGNMAIAETTAVVAATESTKTGIAAFLSTAAGKLAITGVATATIATGAIGGYAITQNNNEEVINEPEIVQEVELEVIEENSEVEENFVKYSNSNYPEFSFEYDENLWELSEEFNDNGGDLPEITNLKITNNESVIEINLQPLGVFGTGAPVCYEGRFIEIAKSNNPFSEIEKIGIVENLEDNNWYSVNYIESEAYLNSIEISNPTILDFPANSTYCVSSFTSGVTRTSYMNPSDIMQDEFLQGFASISYEGENTDEFIEFLETVQFDNDNSQAENILTFTSEVYPDFTFEYDSNIWSIGNEAIDRNVSNEFLTSNVNESPIDILNEITMTHLPTGQTLEFSLAAFAVFGFGPQSCNNFDYIETKYNDLVLTRFEDNKGGVYFDAILPSNPEFDEAKQFSEEIGISIPNANICGVDRSQLIISTPYTASDDSSRNTSALYDVVLSSLESEEFNKDAVEIIYQLESGLDN